MAFPGTFSAHAGRVARKSVDFDGSTEYIGSNGNVTWGFGDTWSISYWINLASPTTRSETAIIVRKAAGTNESLIQLLHDGTTAGDPLTVFLSDSAGTNFKNLDFTGATPSSGTWANIVVTYDGATAGDPVTVYLDGTDVGAGSGTDNTGTMANDSREITVGAHSSRSSGFTDGLIAHVTMWSAVLDQNDVDEVAGQKLEFNPLRASGTYDKQASVAAWFKLGEKAGSTANIGKDYSGAGNDLDTTGNIADADISTDVPS